MQITNIHQTYTREDFLKAINRDDFEEPKKGDGEIAVSLQISEEGRKIAESDIIRFDRRIDMPEYCGIYQTDKAIAAAVEGLDKEDRMFVYRTIRQNFLRENTSGLTEEERQANISLGMKKAEYAAQNFIPEKQKKAFMTAMETIAKVASAGRSDANGNMDYGLTKANYLGYGSSNLVATTNTEDMMKHMDSAAYEEYQKIGAESSNEDRSLNLARYLTNWYTKAIKDKPNMLAEYENKNAAYLKKINDKELPAHFDNIDVSSKKTFVDGLKIFMSGHLGFMSDVMWSEIFNEYWES